MFAFTEHVTYRELASFPFPKFDLRSRTIKFFLLTVFGSPIAFSDFCCAPGSSSNQGSSSNLADSMFSQTTKRWSASQPIRSTEIPSRGQFTPILASSWSSSCIRILQGNVKYAFEHLSTNSKAYQFSKTVSIVPRAIA